MANVNMEQEMEINTKLFDLSTYLWVNEVFGYATTYMIEFPYVL